MIMSDYSTEQLTETNKSDLESGADTSDHFSLITDFDVHLFREGKHYSLYEKLGSHAV